VLVWRATRTKDYPRVVTRLNRLRTLCSANKVVVESRAKLILPVPEVQLSVNPTCRGLNKISAISALVGRVLPKAYPWRVQ
jgi:hypothetical protein